MNGAQNVREPDRPCAIPGSRRHPGNQPLVAKLLHALPILALLGVFLGLEALLPLASAVKIGADEDFELSKVTLTMKGYKLYTEIWNDQPPFNTWLLTQAVKHVSPPILGPRLLTVGFAVLLLASFYLLVSRLYGRFAAAIATLLLIGSPGFIELSSSCMQEIPALAPVVAAFTVLVRRPKVLGAFGSELAAGLLLGLGLSLKLIGIIYLPVLVFLLWNGQRPGFPMLKRAILESLLFLGTAVVSFFLLTALTGTPVFLQLQQSWASHFSSAKSFEYGSPSDRPFQWAVLLKNWDTTVPALLGVVVVLRKWLSGSPQRAAHSLNHLPAPGPELLPVLWLLLTLSVFSLHTPWWPYYYIHNAAPLCACAGIAASWAARRLGSQSQSGSSRQKVAGSKARLKGRRLPRLASLAFCLCASLWIGARVCLQEKDIRNSTKLDACLVLKEIARFKPYTTFLFPHDPIYSFHSDIPVPPHLAMISLKRLWSGDMSDARLIRELETTKPGLILLQNTTDELPFQQLLSREYRLVYVDPQFRFFAHRTISRMPAL